MFFFLYKVMQFSGGMWYSQKDRLYEYSFWTQYSNNNKRTKLIIIWTSNNTYIRNTLYILYRGKKQNIWLEFLKTYIKCYFLFSFSRIENVAEQNVFFFVFVKFHSQKRFVGAQFLLTFFMRPLNYRAAVFIVVVVVWVWHISSTFTGERKKKKKKTHIWATLLKSHRIICTWPFNIFMQVFQMTENIYTNTNGWLNVSYVWCLLPILFCSATNKMYIIYTKDFWNEIVSFNTVIVKTSNY